MCTATTTRLPDIQGWRDFRCPACKALLFRGILVGEIVCRKCGKRLTCSPAPVTTKEPAEAT
jgi:uncharacterized Zn finger protein (UPF0148 family)